MAQQQTMVVSQAPEVNPLEVPLAQSFRHWNWFGDANPKSLQGVDCADATGRLGVVGEQGEDATSHPTTCSLWARGFRKVKHRLELRGQLKTTSRYI